MIENMNKKTAKVIISILILYIISILSFSGCKNVPIKEIFVEKTDTITKTDTTYIQQPPETLYIHKPIPKYITITKVDTIKENTLLITENKLYNDTIVSCQNDTIIQEISISGAKATLDSAKVTLKKQDKVITNTIEVTKYVKSKNRFHIGPSITTGYDFINKQWGAMAGVSLIYRF